MYTVTQRDPLVSRGARLADMRREADMSQQELADAADVSQATISRIEAGKQGMTEVMRVKVADALGLTVDQAWPALTIEEVREFEDRRHLGFGVKVL
jgi:transcriptional regulator with XRE-family HTH domain